MRQLGIETKTFQGEKKMSTIYDYNNHPSHYLHESVDHGLVSWETIARAALYHLNGDQLREVADEVCPPNVECHGCNDYIHHQEVEEFETNEGTLVFCESCVNHGNHLEHLDDEQDDPCGEVGCNDNLDKDGNCPTCSQDPEY